MTLTYEIALEIFDYDPKSGKLFWKKELPEKYYPNSSICKMVNTRCAGKEAANVNKTTGYLQVVFQGKLYQVHRVIWLMEHGSWPDDQLDHKNRQRDSNLIGNLRPVTHAGNAINRPPNSSGHPNIYHLPERNKPWQVKINAEKQKLPQKSFKTLDEALAYRDETREKHNLPHIRN